MASSVRRVKMKAKNKVALASQHAVGQLSKVMRPLISCMFQLQHGSMCSSESTKAGTRRGLELMIVQHQHSRRGWAPQDLALSPWQAS